MFKDRKLLSLYLFYAAFFFSTGLTSYAGKFYGEIGLQDWQIGLIPAVSAFAALLTQPMWGTAADRVRYKRNVLTFALVCAAAFAFVVQSVVSWYIPLLLVLTMINLFTQSVSPISNAIAIEYTSSIGRDFGPVRMMGTVGYQVIILAAGFFFAKSLNGLYYAYGVLLLLAALTTRLLPKVEGHQHGRTKISFTAVFKNRDISLMLCLVFLAQVCSQFYIAFFSKHLGDLGVSNSLTGVITMLSVALEIPFLIFGDKLMRKMSIWKWIWIGLLVNGTRFLILSVAKTPLPIILSNFSSVALMACFEFFPAIYLSRAVSKELRGSIQSTYTMIAFGASKIVGSLLGGFIAEATGIPTVFAICGAMLMTVGIAMTVPLHRRAKIDTTMQ